MSRFSGISNLYGAEALQTLRASHVCVVGLGGVGAWTVEALARSGVGALTLVDLDDICESNINRQLLATVDTVGKSKARLMEQRVLAINPELKVSAHEVFFTASSAARILAENYDVVVDAIDGVSNKALLIARCVERGLRVIVTGAAGGRKDPAFIGVNDLAFSSHDRLLEEVRKKLKNTYGFPRKRKHPYGIPCVYSLEPIAPTCKVARDASTRLSCNTGLGTVSVITGIFGLRAADQVLRTLIR
jgi:tRNA A37 threonylcarbamoyladenosine dehydratase